MSIYFVRVSEEKMKKIVVCKAFVTKDPSRKDGDAAKGECFPLANCVLKSFY